MNVSEVVDRWHRESEKGLERERERRENAYVCVCRDLMCAEERANSEDRRAIITKIAYTLPFPLCHFFLSIQELRP